MIMAQLSASGHEHRDSSVESAGLIEAGHELD